MTERFTEISDTDEVDDSWLESRDAAGGAPPLGYDGTDTSPGVRSWQPGGRLPNQRGTIVRIDTDEAAAGTLPEPTPDSAQPQSQGWQPAGRQPNQSGTILRFD